MTIKLNSVTATLACVAQGIGVAIAPDIAAEKEVREGRLARLRMADGLFEAGILMIWHREKFVSAVMAAFMDMATDCFQNMARCSSASDAEEQRH